MMTLEIRGFPKQENWLPGDNIGICKAQLMPIYSQDMAPQEICPTYSSSYPQVDLQDGPHASGLLVSMLLYNHLP